MRSIFRPRRGTQASLNRSERFFRLSGDDLAVTVSPIAQTVVIIHRAFVLHATFLHHSSGSSILSFTFRNEQVRGEAAETYLLGHTPAALQRLLVQGQMLNPFTQRVFEDVGTTAGMRVLDVGCGPGDVSQIAAAYPPSPLWEQVWTWCTQTFHQAGGNLAMGMKLYGTFLEAGLPAPQLRYEAAVGAGPDWVGYEYWAETVRTLLPLLQQFGIATEEEIGMETLAERLREETVGRGGVARLPVLVSAWFRKR
jgi:hypothetical protein